MRGIIAGRLRARAARVRERSQGHAAGRPAPTGADAGRPSGVFAPRDVREAAATDLRRGLGEPLDAVAEPAGVAVLGRRRGLLEALAVLAAVKFVGRRR